MSLNDDDDEVSISSLNSEINDTNEPIITTDVKKSDKEIDDMLYGDSDDDDTPPPPPPTNDDDEDEDEDDDDDIENIENIEEKENIEPTFDEYKEDNSSDDDDEYDSDDDNYLQKLENLNKKNIISEFHPELLHHNNNEIEMLSKITYNEQGIIIDPLHKTLPFITKYERSRIIGERSKQINMGAKPLVEVEPDVIDGYLIALKEYNEKKIPFIIKRPLPNGGCEYWKFKDLEII